MRTYLVHATLSPCAIWEDNLDVEVVVLVICRLGVSFPVLACEEDPDEEQQERTDDVSNANDRPRHMIPTRSLA